MMATTSRFLLSHSPSPFSFVYNDGRNLLTTVAGRSLARASRWLVDGATTQGTDGGTLSPLVTHTAKATEEGGCRRYRLKKLVREQRRPCLLCGDCQVTWGLGSLGAARCHGIQLLWLGVGDQGPSLVRKGRSVDEEWGCYAHWLEGLAAGSWM